MSNSSRRLRRSTTFLAPLALAGLVAAAPAQAASVTVDRDHVDTSDTKEAGHVDAEGGGLHVWTEGTTGSDKAAGYFDAKAALAAAATTEPTMTLASGGTGGKPGMQLVVDFDRNGNFDGILVGEPDAYGTDWWLSNGSKQFVRMVRPRVPAAVARAAPARRGTARWPNGTPPSPGRSSTRPASRSGPASRATGPSPA